VWYLAEVEVDEVLGLVRHVGAEVAANDGVPGGVVLFVEFLFDVGGDILCVCVLCVCVCVCVCVGAVSLNKEQLKLSGHCLFE
jgi:hypothetical protein